MSKKLGQRSQNKGSSLFLAICAGSLESYPFMSISRKKSSPRAKVGVTSNCQNLADSHLPIVKIKTAVLLSS